MSNHKLLLNGETGTIYFRKEDLIMTEDADIITDALRTQ